MDLPDISPGDIFKVTTFDGDSRVGMIVLLDPQDDDNSSLGFMLFRTFGTSHQPLYVFSKTFEEYYYELSQHRTRPAKFAFYPANVVHIMDKLSSDLIDNSLFGFNRQ